jgi:hypothetical protein
MIPEKGHVLSLDGIFKFADGLASHIPDALEMLWGEQEIVGIDMPCRDEAPRLIGATTWVVGVHQAALVVHEAVEVSASPAQALSKIVWCHLQHFAGNCVAGAQDRAERKDQSLLTVETQQHSHRAAVLGFLDKHGQLHGHAFWVG